MTALTTLRRNFRRIVNTYQTALDAADPCDYSAALRRWSRLRRELLPPPNDTDASLVGRIAAPVKRGLDRVDWPIVDTAADLMVELLWTQPVPGFVGTTDCIRDARCRCDDVFRKAVRTLSRLDDLAELVGETQPEGEKPDAQSAKQLLHGWRVIDEALGLSRNYPDMDYNERRRKLAYLNDHYGGPIKTGRKGSQPIVNRSELIAWWNSLEKLVEKQAEDQKVRILSEKETLRNLRPYGRTARVAPDIGGSVKRRKSRSQT